MSPASPSITPLIISSIYFVSVTKINIYIYLPYPRQTQLSALKKYFKKLGTPKYICPLLSIAGHDHENYCTVCTCNSRLSKNILLKINKNKFISSNFFYKSIYNVYSSRPCNYEMQTLLTHYTGMRYYEVCKIVCMYCSYIKQDCKLMKQFNLYT